MDHIISVFKMHQFWSTIKNPCSNLFAGVYLKTVMYIVFNTLLMKSNRCLVKIRCRPSAKQIFPVIGLNCCQLLWPQGGPLHFLRGMLNKVEERFSAYFHQPSSHQMWKSTTSLFINIFAYIKLLHLFIVKNRQELPKIEGVHLWTGWVLFQHQHYGNVRVGGQSLLYLCTQIRQALSVSHF